VQTVLGPVVEKIGARSRSLYLLTRKRDGKNQYLVGYPSNLDSWVDDLVTIWVIFTLRCPRTARLAAIPRTCTVARFTTKLNSAIELEGGWEVDMMEISFPSDVENVSGGHCNYKSTLTASLCTKYCSRRNNIQKLVTSWQKWTGGIGSDSRQKVARLCSWNFLCQTAKGMGMKFKYAEQFQVSVDFLPVLRRWDGPDLARLLGFNSAER